MGVVVRDKLDEELAATGDNLRRGGIPAEPPQRGRKLVTATVDLHIVFPGGGERRYRLTFVLVQAHSTAVCSSNKGIDHHMRQMYGDPAREQQPGDCSPLISPLINASSLIHQFQVKFRKLSGEQESSAPGPNSTSYRMYRNCTKPLVWALPGGVGQDSRPVESCQRSIDPKKGDL